MAKKITTIAEAIKLLSEVSYGSDGLISRYPEPEEFRAAMHIIQTLSQPLSYAPGDRVKISDTCEGWTKGVEHTIVEAHLDSDGLSYTTNNGGWFSNSDFEFVGRADQLTLVNAQRDLDDENDEEEM